MRRFTPFIIMGILLFCIIVIGLIFDKPAGSFSIWNQLAPPEKGKVVRMNPLPPPGTGKPNLILASWSPLPPPGGGKPNLI